MIELKRISDEEINKHMDNYTNESRSLWESGKARIVKIDEAMSLDSVYQRIAQAQLEADQETVKAIVQEIFEEIEKHTVFIDYWHPPVKLTIIFTKDELQALKQKCGVGGR